MSMPQEPVNPGGPGINRWVIIVIGVIVVAVIAYIIISRRRGSASAAGVSESGGGGAATGITTLQRGAVTINVRQSRATDEIEDNEKDNDKQPTPPVRDREKMVVVHDVRGKRYPEAAANLRREGLMTQRSSPYVGKVTRESPAQGSKVEKGSMITLSGKPWPRNKKDKDKK